MRRTSLTVCAVRHRYGLNQSCTMLLLIAAANSRLALSDTSPTATGVNGGGAIGFGGGARSSLSVADHAKSLFFEYGGRPVTIDRGGYGGELEVNGKRDFRLNTAFVMRSLQLKMRLRTPTSFSAVDMKDWRFTSRACCVRSGRRKSLWQRESCCRSTFGCA